MTAWPLRQGTLSNRPVAYHLEPGQCPPSDAWDSDVIFPDNVTVAQHRALGCCPTETPGYVQDAAGTWFAAVRTVSGLVLYWGRAPVPVDIARTFTTDRPADGAPVTWA